MAYPSYPDVDELTGLINTYYHASVEMPRADVAERYDIMCNILYRQVMPELCRREPRIDQELAEHGSYFQGLQVHDFDMDFGVKLCGLDKVMFETGAERERHYSFSYNPRSDLDIFGNPVSQNAEPFLSIPEDISVVESYEPTPTPPHGMGFLRVGYRHKAGKLWSNAWAFTFKRDIIPFLVKQRLQNLLHEIRDDFELEDEMSISDEIHGPALRINLTKDDVEVPIDLAPMVKMNLPFPPTVTWPRPNADWPDNNKSMSVLEEGVNLIAKKNFYWVESYAEAEAELVRGIDADGGNRKKIHRIAKAINQDLWCTSPNPVIASYDIKNLWFWLIENNPDSESWQHGELGARFLDLTCSLQRAIRNKYLPHYFDTKVNLFKKKKMADLRRVEQEINRFLNDPDTALRLLEDDDY